MLFFVVVHLHRHPNWPIRKYGRTETAAEKIFMQRPPLPLHYRSLPTRTPKAAGSSSACNGKNVASHRRNRFHQCRHRLATPVPRPHQATIYFRCIFCDAFFVTLRFSNLIPYVEILKTFHIKILRYDNTVDNMVFKVFLLSHFRFVSFPTTLASLPPGVMLLNRSTTMRDSATDIENTTRKGAPEREHPNRSVVKIYFKGIRNLCKF